MSAYIVDRAVIDALVTVAKDGPSGVPHCPGNTWYPLGWESADGSRTYIHDRADLDRIGAILIDENVWSVQYRYPEMMRLPGPSDLWWMAPYRWGVVWPLPSAVETLKLADHLEYQSCEHPGWEASEARRILDAIRAACHRRVQG